MAGNRTGVGSQVEVVDHAGLCNQTRVGKQAEGGYLAAVCRVEVPLKKKYMLESGINMNRQ